jgi:hypothetical protein
MMEIAGQYHEDLDEQKVADILGRLDSDEPAGGAAAGGAQ